LEEIHNRTQARPVPNFFAGSILRVKYLDALGLSKPQKRVFTGICIAKANRGLGSKYGRRVLCVCVFFSGENAGAALISPPWFCPPCGQFSAAQRD
jgi:hypothetical protein